MSETIKLLDSLAERLGMKIVRDDCKKFLLRKTLADGGTPRKPIRREWTMLAYVKQGGKCARCRREIGPSEATGDHLISLAQGGRHNKRNVRMLCRECNSSKGANDLVKESKLTGQTIREQVEGIDA